MMAEVEVSGTTLWLKHVAIYGADGNPTTLVGPGPFAAMIKSISSEVSALGFTTLRISGIRYSGASAGRVVEVAHANES